MAHPSVAWLGGGVAAVEHSLDVVGEGVSGGDVDLVTITRREYELLLLKDKAMDVLQVGVGYTSNTPDTI